MPAGLVVTLPVNAGTVDCAALQYIDATGLAAVADDAPKPEFLSMNAAGEIAVTPMATVASGSRPRCARIIRLFHAIIQTDTAGAGWVITDNDGVSDNSGETLFWSIGTLP